MNEVRETNDAVSLKHLGAYLAVYEQGTIAAAARALNRSPSAISRSVKLLEAALGRTLVKRSRARCFPTGEGRLVAARARAIRGEFLALAERFGRADIGAAQYVTDRFARKDFDASRLRALVAVNDLGSEKQAGQRLGLSQPAVSFSLRQLEADLGIALFARSANGMTATTAGATACVFAKRILNELRRIQEEIASAGGDSSGLVRIGGLAYARSRLLPEAITRTIRLFPKITVRTVEGPLSALLAAAHSGEIDAIICARPDPALLDGMTTEPLVKDRMGLFVNASHPLAHCGNLSAQALLRFPFILPPVGSVTRSLLEQAFVDAGETKPEGSVETSSYSVIRRLLLGSDHISFRSMFEFEDEIARGRIVALDLDFALHNRTICILQRLGSDHTPAVRDFLMQIRDIARCDAPASEADSTPYASDTA